MTTELKERIIDVAIKEFTLMGLKFTMNDIARKLGNKQENDIHDL
ncbi:MAG: hypothetical protein V8R14_03875 [Clostridia bacterium]